MRTLPSLPSSSIICLKVIRNVKYFIGARTSERKDAATTEEAVFNTDQQKVDDVSKFWPVTLY